MDSIYLQDIRVPTRIGITTAERHAPQDLYVCLWLQTSIRETAKKDDISVGIDYAKVTEAVVELGKKERKTLERFAEDTAAMVLKTFHPKSVTVCVEKRPPLPLEAARITITRP